MRRDLLEILLLVLVLIAACAGRGASQSASSSPLPARTRLDSVRGTISLEGTGEAPVAMLVTKDGHSLSLTGPLEIDLLRQLEGLEIVAYGRRRRRANDPVEIVTFSVRGRGGDRAVDGILHVAPSGNVLELADGRRLAVPTLPFYLLDKDGKRIWIAGPIAAPTAAGAIDPDRHDRHRNRIPRVVPDSAPARRDPGAAARDSARGARVTAPPAPATPSRTRSAN